MSRNSHFRRGSGVYACRVCGKQTRETGGDESSVQLCLACYDEAGLENEHADGYHDADQDGPNPDCPDCRAMETDDTHHIRSQHSDKTLCNQTPTDKDWAWRTVTSSRTGWRKVGTLCQTCDQVLQAARPNTKREKGEVKVTAPKLAKSTEKILDLVFAIRKNKADAKDRHTHVVYHKDSGFVGFVNPGKTTNTSLDRAIDTGWLIEETDQIAPIEDCGDRTDVVRYFRPGDNVEEENLQACRDLANPKLAEERAKTEEKETTVPTKTTKKTTKKAAAKSNGKADAPKRPSKKDYSHLKATDLFTTNAKGKPTFQVGRDAMLKSILVRMARDEASPAERKLAMSKTVREHPKVADSPTFQRLYRDVA